MGVPQPQVARRAGDIWYTVEPLSRGGQLLRLSTSDSVIDHDDARLRRLEALPNRMRIRPAAGASSSGPRASVTVSVQSIPGNSCTAVAEAAIDDEALSGADGG